MAKLNKVKTQDKKFTCVFNEVIQDKTISWKARGIFIYLWSLPDNWSFSEMEIMTHSIDGRSALRSGLRELEDHHYLKRRSPRNNDHIQAGQTQWILSDKQMYDNQTSNNKMSNKQMSDNRTSNNKMSNKQMSDNRTLQNNHSTKYLSKQNTNLTNTDNGKTKLRRLIQKDLWTLDVTNINSIIWDAVDDWVDNYPPQMIKKAIHQVALTSPSPSWVVTDINNQLLRGCKVHQPKRHVSYGHQPIKRQLPDWAKKGYHQKLHPTSKKMQAKVKKQLKELNHRGDKK